MNACPVCGATGALPRTARGRAFRYCPVCHLLWSEEKATLDFTTEFYRGENPTEAIGEAKRDLYRTMLESAEVRLGKPGRLLDVGCSQGDFLLLAKERGWNVAGIEPVEELAEVARGQGLDVFTGTLENRGESLGPFDLVTYWDVFLLVNDPPEELERAVRLLAPRGLLFMRLRQHKVVRALDRLWTWGGRFILSTNPAVYHPFNYEPRTLHLLCRRAGLISEVTNSPMTRGDAYRVGRTPGTVDRAKLMFDTIARTVEALSGGRAILSPSMQLWARPE